MKQANRKTLRFVVSLLPRPAAAGSPAAIVHAKATNDQVCEEKPAGGRHGGRPQQTRGHSDTDVHSGTILTFEPNDFTHFLTGQAWR